MSLKHLSSFLLFLLINIFQATHAQTTRAVILGVSKYKNFDESKQLKYADKDAAQIHDLIQSGLLGNVDKDNVTLLVNEDAKQEVAMQLIKEALLGPEVKAGDQAIIYFAGHGDVHADNGNGFLLTYGAPADGDYFLGGGIELGKLVKYIEFAVEKGVKTFLITDACRSGSLVSELGSKLTINAIGALYNGSHQLLSCGSDQTSQESERWGGGHGVFTYHLVRGLAGKADEDEDDVIRFFELKDYVRKQVRKETEFRQVPIGFGKEIDKVASLNSDLKEQYLKKLEEESRMYQSGDSAVQDRGLGSPAPKSSTLDDYKELVEKFKNALKSNQLLKPGSYYAWKASQANKQENKAQLEFTLSASKNIHNQMAMAMALSPDGKTLVTASDDSTITLINTSSLIIEKQFQPHWGGVLSVEFSPDGKYLATGSWDETVRIIEVATQETIHKLEGHSNDVRALSFSPDGKVLFSADIDGNMILWDVENGEKLKSQKNSSLRANSSIWHDHLYISSENGGAFVFDPMTLTKKKSFGGRSGKYTALGIHPEGNKMYVSGANGIEFFSLPNLKSQGFIQARVEARKIMASDEIVAFPTEKGLLVSSSVAPKTLGFFASSGPKILTAHPSPGNTIFFTDERGEISKVIYKQITKTSSMAFNLYLDLKEHPNTTPTLDYRLGGRLAVALEGDAQEVINEISRGNKILPTPQEIHFAIEELELALFLNGDDPVMTNELKSKIYLLKGYKILVVNDQKNLQEAISYFEKISSIEPDAAYQYDALGFAYLKNHELEKSKEKLNVAKERVPVWTTPRDKLGQAYFREGDYSQAIEEYNGIVSLRPDDAKGFIGLGDIHLDMGNLEEAENYYEVSAEKEEGNAYLYNKFGDLEKKKGNKDKAAKNYRKSLKLDSSFAQTYVDLASVISNRDSAKLLVDKAESMPSSDAETVTGIADFYQYDEKPDYGKSEAFYEKAIAMDPFMSRAYDGLTEVLVKEDKKDKAREVVAKAEQNMPNKPHTNYLLGNFYKSTGDQEKAKEEYKKAIEKSPSYYDAYLKLFDIYSENPEENMEEAKTYFDKAEQAFQNQFSALREKYAVIDKEFEPVPVKLYGVEDQVSLSEQKITIVDESTRREAVASEKFQSVLEKNPGLDESYASVAIVHTIFGEYYEAEENLKKEIEKSGPNEYLYNQLAEINLKRGRLKEAITYYGKVLEMNNTLAGPWLQVAGIVKDSATRWRLIGKAEAIPDKTYEDYTDIGFFYLYDKNDFKTAKKNFTNARKQNPYYEDAIYGFAEINRLQGKDYKSEEEMRNAINALPIAPEPYYLMGNFKKSKNEIDRAEHFYEKAISKEPFFLKAYIALIDLYGETNFNKVEEYYDKANDRFPESSELNHSYAKALMNFGESDKAKMLLDKVMAFDVNFLPNYLLLEKIYQDMGKDAKAKEIRKIYDEKACEGCIVKEFDSTFGVEGSIKNGEIKVL